MFLLVLLVMLVLLVLLVFWKSNLATNWLARWPAGALGWSAGCLFDEAGPLVNQAAVQSTNNRLQNQHANQYVLHWVNLKFVCLVYAPSPFEPPTLPSTFEPPATFGKGGWSLICLHLLVFDRIFVLFACMCLNLLAKVARGSKVNPPFDKVAKVSSSCG